MSDKLPGLSGRSHRPYFQLTYQPCHVQTNVAPSPPNTPPFLGGECLNLGCSTLS